jgi:NAD(P)-dependent dehydrogenase (short-subunit alcohol dehydrogenase family)
MGRMNNKTALITGGGAGIGRAACQRLAEEGAQIVVTDFDDKGGQETVDLIIQAGGQARFMHHDVTDEAEWEAIMADILANEGRLDVLVNNAGIIIMHLIDEFPLEDFQRQNAVNIDGVFLGLKHGVRAMKKTGKGSIINMSSVAGRSGSAQSVGYCATKGAVRLMTKAAAKEMLAQRLEIRVNSVHPALVETSMAQDIRDQVGDGSRSLDKAFIRSQGRLGRPEEIANGILFLASDESSFSSGSELVLDNTQTA